MSWVTIIDESMQGRYYIHYVYLTKVIEAICRGINYLDSWQ